MVREYRFGLMVLNMMVNGLIIKHVVKEHFIMQMDTYVGEW